MTAARMRTGVSLVAIGALMVGGIALAAGPASAVERAQVNNCGQLEVKPTDLVLACADANAMLTELTWRGWSNSRATGVGTYEVNDCEPTCVAGTTRSYPVRVVLGAPKVQDGTRVLSKVTMTFTKKSPGRKKKVSTRLTPYRANVQQPTPTPTATPVAEPSPSATPVAPAPTAAVTAGPTPTPTPTATATALAIAPPAVTITERKRLQGSARYTLTASSKARGGTKGITSVTAYQANDENAELPTKGTYLGDDAGDGNIWNVSVSCNPLWGDTIRIVVKATDGQVTTIREKRPC